MPGRAAATLLAASVALGACGDAGRREPGADANPPAVAQDSPAASAGGNVTAPMRDRNGKDLGTVTLTESGQGISAAGRIGGLPPGVHGIHLHTVGRCDPPAFESAGGHWNPTDRKHGTQTAGGSHLGDLPNITVARDSSVTVQATTAGGTLRGANALLDADGAAVVVHAKRDDYKSQPSGDSG
jgi:Cu-Zn family superoxide dismutase